MLTINVYSMPADRAKHVSTHFIVKEFACNDGSPAVMIHPQLVYILEGIRAYFRKPVIIHSGYRTPTYNATVGGKAHSQHMFGTAADISIKGVTPAQVAQVARMLMPDYGGIGIYKTFTHVDVREHRADWHG